MELIWKDFSNTVIDEDDIDKVRSGECSLEDFVTFYGDEIESVKKDIVIGFDLDGNRTAYRFKHNMIQVSHLPELE